MISSVGWWVGRGNTAMYVCSEKWILSVTFIVESECEINNYATVTIQLIDL